MFTILRLAWRNLGRNKKRTGLAILAIAVGQFALLFNAALTHGYLDRMLEVVTGPLLGHVQVHARGWRDNREPDKTVDHLGETLAAIRREPLAAWAAPRIYAPVLVALREEAESAMVVGIEPEAESRRDGLLAGIAEGRPGEHRVLIGRALARKLGVKAGDELAVVGQALDGSIANDLYIVAAVIPSTVELVNSGGIVMSLADAQALFAMDDQAHEILVSAPHAEEADALAARLRALPALAGREVLTWTQAAPEFVTVVKVSNLAALITLVLVFIAALAGIANTMMMSTFEKIREFGTLLALGCTPGRLVWLVVTEALLLGLLGVAVGTALAAGTVLATAGHGIDLSGLAGMSAGDTMAWRGIQIPMVVPLRLQAFDILIGAAGVMITSLLAICWPAAHVARLQPMEAMRS